MLIQLRFFISVNLNNVMFSERVHYFKTYQTDV